MTKTLILSLTLFLLLFINMGEAFSVEINSPEIIVVEDSSDKEGKAIIEEDDFLDSSEGEQPEDGTNAPPLDGTEEDNPPN